MLSLFVQPFILRTEQVLQKENSASVSKGQLRAALALYLLASLGLMSARSEVPAFVSIEAFAIVLMMPWLLIRLIPDDSKERLKQGTIYTLIASLCAILMASLSLLGHADDPTKIGPAVALAFLGLLYGE